MTMISRVMGFLRDVVFARIFGADAATDAFFVAFKIPNFLRRLFAEGAFSQAFVPVFAEYQETKEPAALKELIDRVAGTFGVVLFVVTAIGVLAAPLMIIIFGPGFLEDAEKFDLATAMLRITYPYLFFIALTAFAGGILNSIGRFGVPALTPVLLNICLIWAAIWLAPRMSQPVMALAWGVFIAGVAQLAFQIPFLLKEGLMPRPRWGWRHEGVRKIMRLMLPAIFGSSIVQINLLIDTLIASFLVTGSISWLYYSDRIVEFPLGVLGVAIATVILPKLSSDHAKASANSFSGTLDWGLRLVFVIGVPASIALVMLSAPLLVTLFYGGAFKLEDVTMASLSLSGYALGLMGYILVKILAPGFYARQDTKTPVRIGVWSMVANLILNLLLVLPLLQIGFQGAHMGLAIATACSSFLNAFWLFSRLKKEGIYFPQRGWLVLFLRIATASAAMGAVIYLLNEPIAQWAAWSLATRASHLVLIVGAGIGVYFGVLVLVGTRFKPLLRLAS